MIASLFASLFAALAGQPAGAPAPLVAELCNTTPVRVAVSVTYPAGAISERRRGWLVVGPNDCSGGSIGQTTGGLARVHVMSGGYGWPAEPTGDQRCAPASSHDDAAARPPCADGERAFDMETVQLDDRGNHYRLEYTVSCADLDPLHQPLCESGRTGPQGFAERVRTFEICNQDRAAVDMAVAAETLEGEFLVQGWIRLEPAECQAVWRGLTAQGLVYAHTRGTGVATGTSEYPGFCVDPAQAFERIAAGAGGEASCPDGLVMRPFRPVSFGPNVSLMTLTIEPL